MHRELDIIKHDFYGVQQHFKVYMICTELAKTCKQSALVLLSSEFVDEKGHFNIHYLSCSLILGFFHTW